MLSDEEIINAMHEDGCERIENFYVVGPVQKAAVFSFARAVESAIIAKLGANRLNSESTTVGSANLRLTFINGVLTASEVLHAE